ncbi:MAG TPA: Ig-like domain-containing protein [Gemmatimonadaceae bacterium]|nr:Ig-like domain-containing protein [Gemmatimonadaceae bacterium]
MQKLTRSLFALGVLAGLAACGDDVSVTEPPPVVPAVTGISVTPGSATLIKGQTAQLSAVVTANDPSVATTVTWASSNAAVATVSATGLVTAVAPGAATVTATSTANANFKAGAQITVTGSGIRSVRVSPDNAIVPTGSTLQLVANVDADAGVARTVTWTSTNTAVATVSATGVVTGVSAGTTTIVAASTVDASVTGAAAITVRNPVPASISISSITFGTLQTPVNVNNVFGQFEVTLNVDPGDQGVTKVEVLVDGVVACFQNFTVSRSEELALSHVFENVQAAPVTCSINSALFDAATGAASYFNGVRQISARAITPAGTQVVTPSQALTFNNVSGVVLTVTNDNGTDAKVGVNPATGLSWIGGSITVKAVGVSYVQGVSIATVTLDNGNTADGLFFLGKTTAQTITLTATTNGGSTGSKTYAETGTWSATDSDAGNYMTNSIINLPGVPNVLGEAPVVFGTVLSDNQTGPTNTLNFPANALGNATIPPLAVVRVDNTAPGVASANGVAQTAITLGAALIWFNATSSFALLSTSTNPLGAPALSVLNANTVGVDIEEGVDVISLSVYVTAAGVALPTASACDLTGLTLVTTGSQLTETTVSTAFSFRLVFKDALGNQTCIDVATTAGADFTAPTGTVTGPAANTGYNALPPNFAVTASDNASGFTATPLRVTMNRLNITNTTSCIINTGGTCTGGSTAAQPLTFNSTGGTGVDGYYTTSITLVDQAGNTTVLLTNQLYSQDIVAPLFSGGISLPALIAGAATNVFTASVTDNLDLGSIFGVVDYPLADIRYPTQTIGSFGPPLEQSATVNYSVANWIRCINAAGSFATASGQPTTITLTVTDQTTIAQNTTSLTSGAFGANAQTCTGSVGNIAAADILSFTQSAPNYGTGNTQVDIDGATLATGSSTTVTLSAVADVALNSSADPFTRVDFYYTSGTTLIKIGTAAAVLAQTQTNRTYTYTLVWDPDAAVPVGAVSVVAIGVDAQGDGVLTGTQTVTTVP